MIQIDLDDRILKDAFFEVWGQLPDYARDRLAILDPVVRQVDEASELLIKGCPATVAYRTRKPLGRLEIAVYIQDGLEPSAARWALAHELAHLVNGDYMQTTMRIPKRDADEARILTTWLEDMADWTAAIEWGFIGDLRPIAEAADPEKPIPRWWPMYLEATHAIR